MKPAKPCTIIILITLYTTLVSSEGVIDGTLFQQDLIHLAHNILGLQEFQSHVDRQRYVESELVGSSLVSELANNLKVTFRYRMGVLEELQDKLQTLYGIHDAHAEKCCDVPLDESDDRFGRGKINLDVICTSGVGLADSDPFLSEEIVDLMKENLKANPLMKWQYYGSEDGKMAKYPANDFCSPTYDPRLRPWYAEAATPHPKDVVIILDTSGSMANSKPGEGSRLNIAINAAIRVMETLNAKDRVGVVAFSGSVKLPPGDEKTSTCYEEELARAIPVNIDYLQTFVSYLGTKDNTNYIPALKAAFDYFDNTPVLDNESLTRHRVILFLTDGDPTDPDGSGGIMATLRDRNAMLNNSVVILTYGIGDITDDGEEILTNMAHQISANTSYGEPKLGRFEKVTDLQDLIYKMASFYHFFSPTEVPSPIFTIPYIDAFGIGLITSTCLPVKVGAELKGVTCIDIAIGDILSELTHFRQGEFSYAFLIDDEGLLLIHPLLPGPQEVTDDPVYLSMTTVERDNSAVDMMESMMRGENGNATMFSPRVTAKGDVDFTGVYWGKLTATYYWEKIEDTEFTVCVVIGKDDKQASLEDATTLEEVFIYHRLDLKPQSHTCKHFNRLSLKDRSTVKFTGDAFTTPFEYLDLVETLEDVNKYERYMTWGNETNPGFMDGVRNNVALTTKFDSILLDRKSYEHAVWFYIGTVDGIYRIFPGVQLPKMYDHKLRSWYKKTVGYKGLLTMSTPYEDAFGAGLIVTLGHVIYEAGTDHKADDPSIGVMAMDFPMSFIYNLLLTRFLACEDNRYSCFLLDASGFIVAHNDFSQTSEPSDVENVHIIVKEPYIAHELINESVMTKSRCMNLERFRYQYFWTVSITGTERRFVTDDFEIHEVEGSNIFVVIRKYSGPKPASCFCNTNTLGGGIKGRKGWFNLAIPIEVLGTKNKSREIVVGAIPSDVAPGNDVARDANLLTHKHEPEFSGEPTTVNHTLLQRPQIPYHEHRIKEEKQWSALLRPLMRCHIEQQAPSSMCVCRLCSANLEEPIICPDCTGHYSLFMCEECCLAVHKVQNLHCPVMFSQEIGTYIKWAKPVEEFTRSGHECGTAYYKTVTVIDKEGRVHICKVDLCECEEELVTLLRYGVWATSPSRPQVLISMQLLDWYLFANLECQVSVKGFAETLKVKNDLTPREVKFLRSFIEGESVHMYRAYRGKLQDMYWCKKGACPACPKDKLFVAMDGNFRLVHKHNAGLGFGEPKLASKYFLDQNEVDTIVSDHKDIKFKTWDCSQFQAGDVVRSKNKAKKLNVTGVFGSVCKHGVPLKFCNVKDGGEKIGYSVSLMKSLRDPSRKLNLFYDIACVLQNHLVKRGMAEYFTDVTLAVPVFHAYGHKASCQIEFNPRRQDGFGLEEGETTERMWQYLGSFAGITKEQTAVHRLDTLASAMEYYAQRKTEKIEKYLVERITKAEKIKEQCEESISNKLQELHINSAIPSQLLQRWQNDEKLLIQQRQKKDRALTWQEEYVKALLDFKSINIQLSLCAKSTDIGTLLDQWKRMDQSLQQLEKKNSIRGRWQSSDPVFKTHRHRLEDKKKIKMIHEIRRLAADRLFVHELRKKYHDGQKQAKKVIVQEKKAEKKLRQAVKVYNGQAFVCHSGLYPNILNVNDVKDLNADMYKALELSQNEADPVPWEAKKEILDNWHLRNRSAEEVQIVRSEMVAVKDFITEQLKEVSEKRFSLSGNDAFSNGQASVLAGLERKLSDRLRVSKKMFETFIGDAHCQKSLVQSDLDSNVTSDSEWGSDESESDDSCDDNPETDRESRLYEVG